MCELSSFQLEDVETLRPRIAVLLNLEPDHLDRHGTFEWYADAKLRIFEAQTEDDTAVVPRGFGDVPGWARRVEFRFDDPLPAEPLDPRPAQPRERGRRHRCGSRRRDRRRRDRGGAAHVSGRPAPDRARAGARRRPLRQRLEGDERRRSPPRARVLPGLTPARDPRRAREGRVVRAARGGVRPGDRAYLIGEAADEIAAALDGAGVPFVRADDLAAALAAASAAARPSDVVLLSPACASFDQFRDFEARGDAFRRLVEELP